MTPVGSLKQNGWQLQAVAWAVVVLAGCQPADTDFFGTTTPRHGPDELWINNGSEPEWLDPNKCSDGTGGEILWNTFAGLVQAHPATLEPLPEIASRWDISPDGRTYTFHLRPSQWSDGEPLTAHDFVFSFRRLVDPLTASKYASNGHIVKGGAAIGRGEAAPETLGVTALDDLTLEVELEHPLPYVLSFLSFYSFMPIPRHLLDALDRRGIEQDLWTRPEHVVCNGPYRMTEWAFRQRMVFEKNPRYWDGAARRPSISTPPASSTGRAATPPSRPSSWIIWPATGTSTAIPIWRSTFTGSTPRPRRSTIRSSAGRCHWRSIASRS
jgi:ABC-type oligopeptide transport system substrate-binding subunit